MKGHYILLRSFLLSNAVLGGYCMEFNQTLPDEVAHEVAQKVAQEVSQR